MTDVLFDFQLLLITFRAVALGAAFIILVAILVTRRIVERRGAILVSLILSLALQLLHLGPLVLEPNLHNSHRKTCVFGQRFPNLQTINSLL